MGKFDRRSRDQKRKAKLKKEAQRSRGHVSMAYHGNKYKTKELVMPLLRTETGIYESFVFTDHQLTDGEVIVALERLIGQMRQGPLPPLTNDSGELDDEADAIIFNIRRDWKQLADTSSHPTRDELIGILRTILGSVENRTTQSDDSQGYLRYLEGFMKQVGVTVQPLDEDLAPLPEPEDDPLAEQGRRWLSGDRHAEVGFRDEARRLIRKGDAERVVEVCQELIGETGNSLNLGTLETICREARRALEAASRWAGPIGPIVVG